jgi:branched-chain amino acid transport system permease protein
MSPILVQVIVGGLLLGAVYALFSSGLTLIWGMMNIVNFAHGDFVMLGMYVASARRSQHWCWRRSASSSISG